VSKRSWLWSLSATAILRASSVHASDAAPDSISPLDPARWEAPAPTPENSLLLQEIGRDKLATGTRVRYKALALGFPRGHLYSLWSRVVGRSQPTLLQEGFEVDSAGRMTCPAGGGPASDSARVTRCTCALDELVLSASGYVRAEPYRLAIVSEDQSVRAYAEAFPFPVEAGSDSTRLWLELMSPDGLEFAIHGVGFPRGQHVSIVTRSMEEGWSRKMLVPGDGRIRVAVFPRVAGRTSGSAAFTAEVKPRPLTLEWSWGKTALDPP